MKYVIKIIILILCFLGVGVGLWMYLNKYLLKSKASEEIIKVKFSNISVVSHVGEVNEGRVQVDKGPVKVNIGEKVHVDLILSMVNKPAGNFGMSGVDLLFTNTGGNLEFLYTESVTSSTMPSMFDDRVLDETSMTSGTSPKQLKRMMFISTKTHDLNSNLASNVIIPLDFKVVAAGTVTSTITVNASASQVVGPPGRTYSVVLDETAPNLTVDLTKTTITVTPVVPTIIQPTGLVGTTAPISEGKDLLYVNSIATYQSPFRYEQSIELEQGKYRLSVGAKMYVRRGRGMTVALICNDTSCGTKKKNDILFSSPVFPKKEEFSEMISNIVIPGDENKKKYVLRVFCEDGSECDIDYISLEDDWGSERVINSHFADIQTITDPRKQPVSWEVDATANLYGSVDPAFGVHGALMINNSAK